MTNTSDPSPLLRIVFQTGVYLTVGWHITCGLPSQYTVSMSNLNVWSKQAWFRHLYKYILHSTVIHSKSNVLNCI